jgi:murein DD-endopeptidase MepM/ murein hydrolase activator NlpD
MHFQKTTILAATALFLLAINALAASPDDDMVYRETDDKGKVSFIGDNPHPIPYRVEVKFSKLENMRPSVKAPFIFTLKANSIKTKLFSLTPAKNKSYGFGATTRVVPGLGPDTRHLDEFLYLLPFEHGKKYRVGQGYFGSATHNKPNPYAIDFKMDIGSVVCAARGGTVVEVKQDSNSGGPGAEFSQYANFVTIFHNDGTFGNYAHLKQGGGLVKKGQAVKAGQPIGLSGDTGQSSGPHLHFDVFIYNAKGESRNLPVKFMGHQQNVLTKLTEGQYYYALHPNRPSFKVELGADMIDDDVEQIVPIGFNDQFEVTSESLDDTVVVYASNGTRSTMDIELGFELQNLSSSRLLPMKVLVPPLSKQFITLLKPIDRNKSTRYSYSLKRRVIGSN